MAELWINCPSIIPEKLIPCRVQCMETDILIYFRTYTFFAYIFIPGIATCIFKLDSHGEELSSSRNVRLSVLAPPTVRMSNLTVTVQEGDSLSLTCWASIPDTGHPWETYGVSFTWRNGMNEITDSSSKF